MNIAPIRTSELGQAAAAKPTPPPGGHRTATRVTTTFHCDICRAEATDTRRFTVDGRGREVDVYAEHTAAFEESLKPYTDAGRRDTGKSGQRRRAGSVAPKSSDPKATRAWAASQGIVLNARGASPPTSRSGPRPLTSNQVSVESTGRIQGSRRFTRVELSGT
ncbi:Lsr2 family protein [Cellulomonas sp. zg-ZUI199]|uniref:Lsr2 family protein n=1 Tax=Cellulomonas wangleii TaxID=2816956 RepID=A0ABX8D5W7_9CELL|nr:Lsr2 family protein [Cellulomonas wangleii]QVI62849.1 Lsr2 family protein [Cellulomonas wangleii]